MTWKRGGGPPVELIVVAASLGGPAALVQVLARFPEDLPVPIAVVQHMPHSTIRWFVGHLDRHVRPPVEAMRPHELLHPGRVYLATGRGQWALRRTPSGLTPLVAGTELVHGCLPAADPLFFSAAEVVGRRCLAVVLTGMGEDGARGAAAIRAAGGRVLVQDEATSAVWGMPGAVVRLGAADEVVPLSAMGDRILDEVGAIGV